MSIVNSSSHNSPPDHQEGYDILDTSPLSKGSRFCIVKDLDLACCLISIGIKIRTTPPVRNVKLPNGNRDLTFCFCDKSEDGKYITEKMIHGYYNDAKFVQENPEHPMAYAIATVKNRVSLRNAVDKSIPCLAFRKTAEKGAVIYVQEGSKKHQNCVAKGMVHVDPESQVVRINKPKNNNE